MFFRPFDHSPLKIAVLGNALPRLCGLATYTSHSVEALRTAYPEAIVDHYAMDDGHGARYGSDVAMTIPMHDEAAYVRAAKVIQHSGAQLLWLHHEFGIFGGVAGDHILALLRHLDLPVVVTLHTVLAEPSEDQRRAMDAILGAASQLIVMAGRAADLLHDVYGADRERIHLIPHGAPDRPLADTKSFRMKLGLGAGPIVLTFGLLSPGKGIETAIRALPAVVERHPDLRYYIVGATHPVLVREKGEAYRESLIALAAELGLQEQVRFVDRFVENDELLDYLQAADVYLTPYPGCAQVTSGTLAYALAMGKPVVSTPYVHAEEALADGIGTLVPVGDSAAISAALLAYIDDPEALAAHARKIWESARQTIWAENARAVMTTLANAAGVVPTGISGRAPVTGLRQVQLSGIAAMTDDVGIVQHSLFGVPDRRHGYCIDDNARALMLLCQARDLEPVEQQRLTRIYAAFVEHAWHEDVGGFRNFMGFDRQWLEDEGSEDSNGRTLWALGHVMRDAPQKLVRAWATALFNKALPLGEQVTSPRAIAFTMLGLAAVLDVEPDHERCRARLRSAVTLFNGLLADAQRPAWPWFEIVLAYDNARLPQAMIEAGRVLGDAQAIEVGLATLRWLMRQQRSADGLFRPVGTESFGEPFTRPARFDQQPLEAAATIDACRCAYQVDADPYWIEAAHKAFTWFEGENDLGVPLASEDGTLCYDGLTPMGVNLNMGAESILALQMALHSMAELARMTRSALAQSGTGAVDVARERGRADTKLIEIERAGAKRLGVGLIGRGDVTSSRLVVQ
jgi:glycosyltransferase involved in cell wall biosynthesis